MSTHKTETTLVLKRIYEFSPKQVFAAFTTKASLEKWYTANADFVIHSIDIDLRVGGKLVARFGPKGDEPITETDEYVEILPGKKLVFDMTLTQGTNFISKTRITIEFNDIGGGKTELILTDVGDDAWHHAQGWRPALDLLARHLATRPS
jgi:uncharacterized protein YndB with AHSA1/START domain